MKMCGIRSLLLVATILLFVDYIAAQQDSLPPPLPPEDVNPDLLEDYLQSSEDDDGFEFNTLFEDLAYYEQHPLNLNKATREELVSLLLLSDIQINELISYRQQNGDLIAIYELQAIPSFNLNTITSLLPYVSVKGGLDDFQLPIGKMLYEGKNELFLRWSRILEQQKGYGNDTSPATYEGDQNKLYVRYRHSYSNRLRYGFTAEKDAGEALFKGSNKSGFDYYSAHFYLKDYNRWLKSLALGDYSVSLGQGLILYSGFGGRKSSQALDIKRGDRTIRPYSSADENNFMRGAAITASLSDQLDVTAFASYNRRDGNILAPDTLDNEVLQSAFSSLQLSGLHRTQSEIDDEDAIKQWVFGGSVKYSQTNWQIALNGLFNQFDKPLLRTPQPYNRFYFNGDQLLNVSLDYSFLLGNYNFYGETAVSDNGKIATIHGLLLGLDKRLSLALSHRYFDIAYQAIDANPFAESTGGRNENGFYIGMEYQLARRWKLSGYADLYRHPWLRFGVDAPSNGTDYRARLTYYQKRKLEIYLEIHDERKDRNAPGELDKKDILVETRLLQSRLHINQTLTKTFSLRSRLDVGFYDDGSADKLTGFVLYQDVIYKPAGLPLSLSARYAIFDTPGYALRFYEYENDLLYSFSIPPYYNKGTKFYLNLRYRATHNLTVEGRFAQTFWSDQDVIGSSGEQINGQTRSEVKAQIKYQF